VPFIFYPKEQTYKGKKGMNNSGRIIIVGKNGEWINKIHDLLSTDGYELHCSQDLKAAKLSMASVEFNLMIVAIEEDGESQRQSIREIFHENTTVPVILIAKFFSPEFLLEAFNLPIIACFVDPVTPEQLKKSVSDAVQISCISKANQLIRQQLGEWDKQLAVIEKNCTQNSRSARFLTVSDFMDISFYNILNIVKDLRFLSKSLVNPNVEPEACHMMDCPRLDILNKALHETIDVLELTKNAFKSRELGLIRRKLEGIMNPETGSENFNKALPENDDNKVRHSFR
jgi:AmiR/NasT family two-component response regulator